MSSTSRIFHQPASAVWVWSRTSPSSVVRATNRLDRNTKATSSPEVTPQSPPQWTPAPITAAIAAIPVMSVRGSTSEK